MALSGTGHEVLSPLPGDVERVSTCITPASGGMGKRAMVPCILLRVAVSWSLTFMVFGFGVCLFSP